MLHRNEAERVDELRKQELRSVRSRATRAVPGGPGLKEPKKVAVMQLLWCLGVHVFIRVPLRVLCP